MVQRSDVVMVDKNDGGVAVGFVIVGAMPPSGDTIKQEDPIAET